MRHTYAEKKKHIITTTKNRLKCMNVSTCQIMRGGVEKAKKETKQKKRKGKKPLVSISSTQWPS